MPYEMPAPKVNSSVIRMNIRQTSLKSLRRILETSSCFLQEMKL